MANRGFSGGPVNPMYNFNPSAGPLYKDPMAKWHGGGNAGGLWGNAGYSRPQPTVNTGSSASTGGGGGSGGSGGGYVAAAAPAAPAYDPMAAIREIMAAQQRARDEAYRIGREAQEKNYAFARGQVDDTTDRALQEAYINRMMTQRNLPQQLSAQGLNGGLSETTTASLANNYGNARNALETERTRQMGQLLNVYQNNLAQLAAQRANGQAAALSAMAPQLMRIAAANTPTTVSTTQGDPGATKRLMAALGYDELY